MSDMIKEFIKVHILEPFNKDRVTKEIDNKVESLQYLMSELRENELRLGINQYSKEADKVFRCL